MLLPAENERWWVRSRAPTEGRQLGGVRAHSTGLPQAAARPHLRCAHAQHKGDGIHHVGLAGAIGSDDGGEGPVVGRYAPVDSVQQGTVATSTHCLQ